MSLAIEKDAFGHALLDYLITKNGKINVVTERDDGYIDVSRIESYFYEYNNWPIYEKKAMGYIKGRVLDIGCGAGRNALYLQRKGFDVIGIDISPLAIKVCKHRGVKKAMVLSFTEVNSKLGKFDTVLMFGSNFGLFENSRRAKWLLKRLFKLTSERGKIIAETLDPYKTDKPEHLVYHKLNKKKGRMAGQVRIRLRYKKFINPWFDYLFVSKKEMETILKDTGWKVSQFIESQGAVYIAIIEKKSYKNNQMSLSLSLYLNE